MLNLILFSMCTMLNHTHAATSMHLQPGTHGVLVCFGILTNIIEYVYHNNTLFN